MLRGFQRPSFIPKLGINSFSYIQKLFKKNNKNKKISFIPFKKKYSIFIFSKTKGEVYFLI